MNKIFLTLLLVLSACYYVPKDVKFPNYKEYDMPKDKVWERVVQFFAERNIPIQTIEKDSGIIYAEPELFGKRLADCGVFGTFEADEEAEGVIHMNVFVKPLSAKRTALTVNVSFSNTFAHDPFIYGRKKITCESKGVLEQHVLDYIDADKR